MTERKPYHNYSDEDVAADIAEQSKLTAMPEATQAAMKAFHEENLEAVSECFSMSMWALARLLGERTGREAELALRTGVIQLLRAVTHAAVATNDALGKPVLPGRVAMVAWTVCGAELDRIAEIGMPAGTSEKLLRALFSSEDEVFGEALPAEIAATKEG